MKRLLALLLLAVAPAFAQELPPIYDPVFDQTYTPSTTTTTTLQNINQNSIGTPLTLYDDGTTFTPIDLEFDFYYFGSLFDSVYISQNGFISFTSNANGCCSGNQLPFLSNQSYYNVNNSIFAMWSDLADFNAPGNPYYKSTLESFTVGWYGIDELGSGNKFDFEITLLSDSSFSIAYGNFDYAAPTGRIITSGFQGDTSNEYYTIYYGNDPTVLENNTYTFTSSLIALPPPPPPEFLYWNTLAGENQNFTITEPGVVRYGAMGSYLYQELQPGTYECSNGAWGGDPIGGVIKSCEFGSNESPQVAVNCETNPLDPSCIINSIIDDEGIFVADNTGLDTGSDPIVEEDPVLEEMFADVNSMPEETFTEEPITEESLEEMLAEETEEVSDVEELVADVKELANEEKAATLADSISKDVLEAALSIAADATSSGSAASESNSSDSSKTSSTAMAVASSEIAASETVVASIESSSESVREEYSSDSSSSSALDILETGRQLGQEALAATLAGTEASALESLSEAESIAIVSSTESVLASAESVDNTTLASIDTQESQTANESFSMDTSSSEDNVTVESNEMQFADTMQETIESFVIDTVEETQSMQFEDVMVVDNAPTQQTQEITADVQTEEVIVADIATTETVIESTEMQQVVEVQMEQQSAIEFTTVEETMEIFANNISQTVMAEQEELENSIIQQAIASSQTNEEENKMGFAEAEAVTIASDPALANAFNVGPNTASLELLGVLGSRAEEKSDAELRAEQVVAANKEQQDAINANYMEADQSGILAAIGSETDVTSYRTAMIRDNNVWYKPEDIYKGVIIKDNVRGSYFLEKGNTDTYKKMVEEQYKDE